MVTSTFRVGLALDALMEVDSRASFEHPFSLRSVRGLRSLRRFAAYPESSRLSFTLEPQAMAVLDFTAGVRLFFELTLEGFADGSPRLYSGRATISRLRRNPAGGADIECRHVIYDQEERNSHYRIHVSHMCDGKKPLAWGFFDWLSRIFGMHKYVYELSTSEETQTTDVSSDGKSERTRVDNRLFNVVRTIHIPDSGQPIMEWQCTCKRWWSPPRKVDSIIGEHIRLLEFHDARTAEEYARKLRHGIPQNWEVLLVIATALWAPLSALLVQRLVS